jgi:hypothetical protein
MPLRAPRLLPVLLLALLACAGAQRQGQTRLREQLDAYSLPKPLAEVWPEALRFVSEHGFSLVGNDRRVVGEGEQGFLGKIFSRGHETVALSDRRWSAETGANEQHVRYRVVGTATGPSASRIEYFSIAGADPSQGGDQSGGERVARDLQLELDFVARYDAERANKMAEAARGGQR